MWPGEAAELHAEDKLFVTEVKVRCEEAVEEEFVCDGDLLCASTVDHPESPVFCQFVDFPVRPTPFFFALSRKN